MNVDNRIAELLDLAAREGIKLPMTPEQIVELENDGHTVNLLTGEIEIDGASVRFELTAAGEAIQHVWPEL